jgi:hypothetical protein
LGKNFFTHIAPCTDIQQFYGRFREGVAAGQLHYTFRSLFVFARNPCTVTVTLVLRRGSTTSEAKTVRMLVQPLKGKTTEQAWGMAIGPKVSPQWSFQDNHRSFRFPWFFGFRVFPACPPAHLY